MADNIIDTLKVKTQDGSEEVNFYPITLTKCITNEEGKTIEEIVSEEGGQLKLITQEYYDAHKEEIDAQNVAYCVVDGYTMPSASDVGYDNTTSKLEATNVQDAIDEINTSIPTDDHINSLIDAKLGVIENGSY